MLGDFHGAFSAVKTELINLVLMEHKCEASERSTRNFKDQDEVFKSKNGSTTLHQLSSEVIQKGKSHLFEVNPESK